MNAFTQEDHDTLPKIFNGIEGWLWPDAGWLTTFLMNLTRDEFDETANAIIELGTYKGKYLSLLYYLSRNEKSALLGVDVFKLTTPEEVRKGISELFSENARLSLLEADTKTLTANDLLSPLDGVKAKFISIDAEHSAKAVYSDLKLAQQILTEGGIIAVDDYTNVHCPGVTEGAIQFLLSPDNTRLAPFTSCCNKLFLTTRSHQETYRNITRQFIDEASFTTSGARYYTRTKSQNEQRLCGHPILVISHTKGSVSPENNRQ